MAACALMIGAMHASAETDVTSLVGTSQNEWNGTGTYASSVERFYGSFPCDAKPLHQSLTGLSNGVYMATLKATSNLAWTSSDLVDGDATYAYVYATSDSNTDKSYFPGHVSTGVSTYYERSVVVEVTNGELELGLGLDNTNKSNWHTIQIVSLIKYDSFDELVLPLKQPLLNKLNEANSYYTNSDDNSANTAKATFKEAIDAAQEVYDAADTYAKAVAAASDFTDQIAALEAAYEVYAMSGAMPHDDYPFDITFKITNPTFGNNNASGWDYTGDAPGFQTYGNAEYFQKNFDISQTINGLPEGYYNLKVKAFQRPGAAADVISAYVNAADKADGTFGVTAEIYVNSGSQKIKNAASPMRTTALAKGGNESNSNGYYIPNDMNSADKYFTEGYYENETEILCTTGTVKFGFRCSDGTGGAYWTIFDDFRLYLTGAIDLEAFKAVLANAVVEAQKITEGTIPADVYSTLQAVITENNKEYATSAEYTAATEAIDNAAEAARAYIEPYASYNANLATADEAYAAHVNAQNGSEGVALKSEIDNTSFSSADDYSTAATNLGTKTATFNAAYPAYDALANEIVKATALGVGSETISSYAVTAETTAAVATTNTQALMVDEYDYVSTNYSYAVNLGTWTTVNATERNGQHWNGSSTSTYSEQNEGWGAYSWTCSYNQDLSLPAGSYVFKVAGRKASNGVSLILNVTSGGSTLGTVNDFPNADTGLGIDTDGATNFSVEGTYANSNNGYGWQWRYVKFTLKEPATVNVAVSAEATTNQQWVSFCNATVQTDDADNVALMEALVALNDAKTAATLTQVTANVGTGIFQISQTENETLWGSYSDAKDAATEYELTSSSTASEVNSLTTALTDAQTAYSAFITTPTLNAPAADKRYNVSIVETGKDWNGNAITFIAGGRTDMGLYGVKYLAAANAYLNQALKFTAVDGEKNTYKVSAINAETGAEQYLTTGSTYGGNNDQIRTTDDASKAMWVKAEATTTTGEFQLRNMSANKIIANNNNNDMYTANSCNFTISEAAQTSVNITISADVKYATRIFPFIPELPSGVKAYSCEAADGNVLTLVEVAEPAANVPYILEAAEGQTSTDLTSWGTAAAESYTKGYLTGVYTDTTAPEDSYVLQNQSGKVGFYQVGESVKPTVGANRAYLTVSAEEGGARFDAFFFDEGQTDGINAINVLTNGEAEIFNTNGVRQNSLQKGLNIIRANGKTVKIMVK